MKGTNLTDEQIDALLDIAESSGQKAMLHERIQERDRKRQHVRVKASQPELSLRGIPQHNQLLKVVNDFFHAPLTPGDMGSDPQSLDFELKTIPDTLAAGDVEDTIFAALRVCRKLWALNFGHLGPIEKVKKEEKK